MILTMLRGFFKSAKGFGYLSRNALISGQLFRVDRTAIDLGVEREINKQWLTEVKDPMKGLRRRRDGEKKRRGKKKKTWKGSKYSKKKVDKKVQEGRRE